MPVGDVNSTERGSGARYNDGKIPLDLLPLRLLVQGIGSYPDLMAALADIQERKPHAISKLMDRATFEDLKAAARVFEFGKRKYAAWNWTKGMAWSIPLACAARHLLAIEEGAPLDDDSGLSHIGHFWCNVIMLDTFSRTFPEGDDLPPAGSLG